MMMPSVPKFAARLLSFQTHVFVIKNNLNKAALKAKVNARFYFVFVCLSILASLMTIYIFQIT
jgi:hypothetical protein